MKSNTAYLRYTWFILIMIFLVILAGGVVRMTQSGMGCPDWPTCFGRWIPPTNAGQLPPDYEKYLRQQDIDHTFNAWHTWIEYINRLLGALLGVFIFIHLVWSVIKFRNNNRNLVYLSLIMLLAVGFQGWLGKKVVDTNLAAVKVTIHMLVALIIAALPVLIISRLRYDKVITSKALKRLTIIILLIVVGQIVLGTFVREQTDEISRAFNYEQRKLWIGKMDDSFLVHRSFSWVVAAACILLAWKCRPVIAFRRHVFIVLFFMIMAFAAGLVMFFLNVPAWAQPAHLLLASLLAITLFSFRLQMK